MGGWIDAQSAAKANIKAKYELLKHTSYELYELREAKEEKAKGRALKSLLTRA